MYRFYCPEADFKKTSILITDAHEIHHIKDVLRMKKANPPLSVESSLRWFAQRRGGVGRETQQSIETLRERVHEKDQPLP